MKTIEEVKKLDPFSQEFFKEIIERQEFARNCVGWLYPRIIQDEVEDLLDFRQKAIDEYYTKYLQFPIFRH